MTNPEPNPHPHPHPIPDPNPSPSQVDSIAKLALVSLDRLGQLLSAAPPAQDGSASPMAVDLAAAAGFAAGFPGGRERGAAWGAP